MTDKARLKGQRRGHGTGGFMAQRGTALALLVLGPWFVISVALAARHGAESALAFLTAPVNAALTAIFVAAACWHAQIGMREILEDYIGKPSTRGALEVLNIVATALAAAAALYALAKLSLGV